MRSPQRPRDASNTAHPPPRSAARRPLTPAQPSGEIPISRLVAILWARRVVVLAVLSLGLGLGLGALAMIPPRYETSAYLLVEPSRLSPTDELLQADRAAADGIAIDSQVRVLSSRGLVEDVVEALDLAEDSAFLAATGGAPTTQGTAVDRLTGGLDVARDGKTRVIRVGFQSHDPKVSALIANAVAERYIVGQLSQKYATARGAIDYLEPQLSRAETDYAAARADLAAFRASDAGRQALGDGVGALELARLTGDTVAAAAESSARRAELVRLRRLVDENAGPAAYETLGGSAVLQNLFALKNQALKREAELRARYGERHPLIVDVRFELAEIETRIRQEQAALLGRHEAEAAEAAARAGTLERELARLKTESSAGAEARLTAERLVAEAGAKRDLVEGLRLRLEGLSRADAVERPDARVISPAIAPKRPTFPNPFVFLGLAFTASLTSGVLLAFALEGRERGFRDPKEIEADLGRPCLGSLGHLGRRGSPPPWRQVTEAPDGDFAETMRGIVAELGVERRETGAKILLLTSSVGGEGGAALALALARATALSGARVLLIEARLRDPRLARQMNLPDGPGLAEVLVEGRPLDEAISHDREVVPALALLPAGRLGDVWPTRLFGPDGMPVLLQSVRKRFDLVLISAAPVLEQAEARALARLCDGTVLAVAFRTTPREQITSAVDLLHRAGGKLEGTILNLVDRKVLGG